MLRVSYFLMVAALLNCVGCQTQDDEPRTKGSNVADIGTARSDASLTTPVRSQNGTNRLSNSRSANRAEEVFRQRILPILQAENPSSCTECHLAGVDLKAYILDDQASTFAGLVAQGLINVTTPADSKILQFIERTPSKPSLISAQARQVEYAAFKEWILAAAADPELQSSQVNQPIGPSVPPEVIRHARRDRVMASFLDNIWTEVGRCAACHSPDRNQQQVAEHGEQVSWIKLDDPVATLNYMVAADLINTDSPESSLLLRKPTLQTEHGGGQKMVVGDRSYKQFRRFIDDYANIVQAKYSTTKQLPAQAVEVSIVSDIWLKLTDVPEEFDQMLLQVDLYQQTDSGWTEHRVATSDRPVFGKGRLWQHSLSLTAPRDAKQINEMKNQQLSSGKYRVKLYVDQTGKLAKDFRAVLDESDFVGQVEVESRWPAGYNRMTVIRFPE